MFYLSNYIRPDFSIHILYMLAKCVCVFCHTPDLYATLFRVVAVTIAHSNLCPWPRASLNKNWRPHQHKPMTGVHKCPREHSVLTAGQNHCFNVWRTKCPHYPVISPLVLFLLLSWSGPFTTLLPRLPLACCSNSINPLLPPLRNLKGCPWTTIRCINWSQASVLAGPSLAALL